MRMGIGNSKLRGIHKTKSELGDCEDYRVALYILIKFIIRSTGHEEPSE